MSRHRIEMVPNSNGKGREKWLKALGEAQIAPRGLVRVEVVIFFKFPRERATDPYTGFLRDVLAEAGLEMPYPAVWMVDKDERTEIVEV